MATGLKVGGEGGALWQLFLCAADEVVSTTDAKCYFRERTSRRPGLSLYY